MPGDDYAAFIDAWFAEKGLHREAPHGLILDAAGKALGEHSGIHHFTIGQRKGLRIAAAAPLYVIATDAATQTVRVGSNDDLLRRACTAGAVNWVSIAPIREPRPAQVKIRNRHAAAPATLVPLGDPARVEVRFDEPQRAVTPGQAAVFYDGDLLVGGGWIE